jgi:hypothetical protein
MKKDWYPFKGLTLDIRFRGTPEMWTRGQIVSWNPFSFQFVRQGRVRPMWYIEEEIQGIKVVFVRGDQT